MQLRIKGHFGFRTYWTKFWNILKHRMSLKLEIIVRILRKIIQLNADIILKSTNEYYRKIISKSGRKMNLYPAISGIGNFLVSLVMHLWAKRFSFHSKIYFERMQRNSEKFRKCIVSYSFGDLFLLCKNLYKFILLLPPWELTCNALDIFQ